MYERVIYRNLVLRYDSLKIFSLHTDRYFYLIVFAMYVREAGPKEFPQTFKEWMDQHASLRDMIAEGRGKLEWERKIPDEKLVDLKEMLAAKDFKATLPKVNTIHNATRETCNEKKITIVYFV